MKLRLYAVLDKAVQAFNAPLVFRSEGEALRSFHDAVVDPKTQFNKYKRDYSFCFLGYYDDSIGAFECGAPVVVAEASTIQQMYADMLVQDRDESVDYFPRAVS